jgi:hypothetical protein
MEQTIQTEKEAVKTQIKTKEQLLERLNDIIEQKAKRVEGQIIMPTFNDVRGAIDTYNKMLGYYAPQKQDVNFTENKLPKWMLDEEE